eukprot:9473550-Pyramimonas_sp.AAC.1
MWAGATVVICSTMPRFVGPVNDRAVLYWLHLAILAGDSGAVFFFGPVAAFAAVFLPLPSGAAKRG